MVDAPISRFDSTRRKPPSRKPKVASAPFVAERRASPPRPAREFGELALRTTGVGLAVVSTAFAAYMISDVERRPQFAGLEHLAIYSRPTVIAAKRIQTQLADQRGPVDYTPVGSIGEPQSETGVPGFSLLSVRSGVALLQTPTAIVKVSPGDVVEGLGRVAALERHGEKWALVTAGGVIVGD
ncbi:hypothetical protein [Methylosinus sporium]|uniref:Uncharacterized protein n=1 Tax=Methylosinus sporium TaxID=428 RepID=A0A2U1SRU5_METSR|nr:hypothetical protein [Methylosinus sporium]PWB94331.1 hypothetical protein C5689_08390 [Methylosinus sporium]